MVAIRHWSCLRWNLTPTFPAVMIFWSASFTTVVPVLGIAGQYYVAFFLFGGFLEAHRAFMRSERCFLAAALSRPFFRLVGEICGSPIRSNGRLKLGSRSPRT